MYDVSFQFGSVGEVWRNSTAEVFCSSYSKKGFDSAWILSFKEEQRLRNVGIVFRVSVI